MQRFVINTVVLVIFVHLLLINSAALVELGIGATQTEAKMCYFIILFVVVCIKIEISCSLAK